VKDPWDGYQDIRTIAAVCAIVAKKEEIMLDLTNERTPVDPKPLRLVGVLNDAGYHAYLVGGCVRDYVLGRPVHDYDLNTSATPEEIASLFPGSVLVGNNFGVSRVEFEGEVFEVGTFRLDGVYTDSRRPDSVVYTTDVLEDLKRRDFVMNTLLMDRDGNVIDHLGARLDLTSEVVRCVGDPEQRFREDKLRMLRAVRFAAKLQFKLDGATFRAIKKMWADVLDVPTERVRDELTLTLTSGDAV
jgi:tRNA nucleotidyltransferase/poly(A) polymerase